jgi:hypothetical protein
MVLLLCLRPAPITAWLLGGLLAVVAGTSAGLLAASPPRPA